LKRPTGSLESHRKAFLEALRVRGYAEASLRSYGASVALFGRYLGGGDSAAGRGPIRDIRAVDGGAVAAYGLWLSRRGYSANTRHMHIKALRRFFEHLEAVDAVLLNPCAGLPLPRLPDRPPRGVLSIQEARRILEAPDTGTARGIRDRAILELFYSTGIRGEEMAALRLDDADWRGGFARVERGKFARGRMVPVGRTACEWLRRYATEIRPGWIPRGHDGGALWLSSLRPHRPMGRQAIAVMVCRYKSVTGIDRPGRTHLWRHTCATHLVAGGADIAYVQQLLGHRSLETTQLYTRVVVQDVRAALNRSHPRSRVRAGSAIATAGPTEGGHGQ